MDKFRGMLLGAVFVLMLFGGSLLFILSPKADYSETERRPLAAAPDFRGEKILDGSSFRALNGWITDRFPGRDGWRSLNVQWTRNVLRQPEADGFVLYHDSVIRLEKEVNEASLAYAGERFGVLYERYLQGTDCRIYAAVIPDKSHYLKDAGYPVMDLSRMETLFYEAIPGAVPVSLSDALTLDSYYLTDSHWRQERILPAADTLLQALDAGPAPSASDFGTARFSPFFGVYAGQSALDPDPEEILWFTGSYLEGLQVTDPETHRPVLLADPKGCDPRDPYTLFLGGAKAVLRIEDPEADNDRELVVFRDSFGSAIAPLLAGNYRTVTLIDPRYIAPDAVGRYVRFTNQDVLFLFSAVLLNNSSGLR